MNDLDWADAPEETQGGAAWHDWRKQGIGASDAPIIMGASPWKTPYQLWLEKTGQKKRDRSTNWAQSRGNRLEPIARQKYEQIMAIEMPAKIFKEGHLLASMDGWNNEFCAGLEIKCPGYPDHSTAMAGDIPEKYIWQLVHQAVVTGAAWIDYFSYYVEKGGNENEGDCRKIRFNPDKEKASEYLAKVARFWECIQKREPPAMTDKDFTPIDSDHLRLLADRYESAKMKLDVDKANLDCLKKEITDAVKKTGHTRIECGQMKVYEVVRKGSVNMDDVKNYVDVEKHRKPDTRYYKIEITEPS